MLRARETCELSGSAEQAVINDGLKEWDYGIFEGRTTKEIQEEIPGWSVWNNEIVDGETIQDVGMRADSLIREALGSAPHPDRIAFFAHAHILRVLAARWIGFAPEGGKHFTLGTASASVLGWEREIPVILRWNQQFES
jgi:probable phosphoglycerate mutase